MSIILVIASIVLGLVCIASASMKLREQQHAIDVIGGTVGVPIRLFPVLASLELAGAIGVIAGLWIEPLGIAAAAGLVLYFVGAAIGHLRVGDIRGRATPMLPLVLAVLVLVLRIATA